MEWTLFAILQMFVIATAVGAAFWLRNRQLSLQNKQLRAHISVLESEACGAENDAADPQTWLTGKIESITDDQPYAPLLRLILQQQLQARDDFDQGVIEAAEACGLGAAAGEQNADDVNKDAQIADLEQALAQVRLELEGMQEEGGEDGQAEELKNLLQQYTKDSRDMMACIQTLEKENAALKAQLEPDAAAAEPTPDTSVQAPQPPADNPQAGAEGSPAPEANAEAPAAGTAADDPPAEAPDKSVESAA